MRGYYFSTIVALIATLAVVTSLDTTISECPPDKVVRLSHPEECHLYYICENGEKIIASCPEGLQFNPVLQQCDWPILPGERCFWDNVDTQPDVPDENEKTTERSENERSTESNASASPVTDDNTYPDGTCLGTCPDSDSKDKTTHLPVYNDCTKFCKCSNGEGILQDCPKGLHFDKKNQICNWPRSANCPWK